jgi:hypothetical protein
MRGALRPEIEAQKTKARAALAAMPVAGFYSGEAQSMLRRLHWHGAMIRAHGAIWPRPSQSKPSGPSARCMTQRRH